jgi:ADP-heptose:LPS heptosyltransferase
MNRMSEVIRLVKRAADRFAFLLFRIIFRPRSGGSSKTIVVIRTDGIGDLVFFLRYVADLKKYFADYRIVVVCRDEAAPLAPSGDLISYRYLRYRRDYLYRLWVIAKIRSMRPSLTVYASYHRQHIGDEMTILSGAERVVAFDGNDEIIQPAMREANDRYFSDIVKVEDHSPEWKKYQLLFERLGIQTGEYSGMRNVMLGGTEESDRGGADPYILLTPGGSSSLRRWPWERFAGLGDRLAEQTGMRIVLCGNRAEKVMLGRIAGMMVKTPEIVANLPIQAVVDLIKRARIVVGNESGLLHIAASVRTPAVVILGGGHFSRYFPYGSASIVNHKIDCYECNWKCLFPEVYCLTRIAVDDVVREVGEVLTHPP